MFGRVVLGPVVGVVVFAWSPVYTELLLTFPVAEPMEAHVHGFGSFWLDFAIDNCICHGIVGLQWGRGLFVPQFF